MAKFELSYWKALIITVSLSVGGWAVFSLAKLGITEIMVKWGVTSEFYQLLAILGVVTLIVALLGFGVKSAFNKVVGVK